MTTPISESDQRRYGYETLLSYNNYSCQNDCTCANMGKERSNYDIVQQALYSSNNQQDIVKVFPMIKRENNWKQT